MTVSPWYTSHPAGTLTTYHIGTWTTGTNAGQKLWCEPNNWCRCSSPTSASLAMKSRSVNGARHRDPTPIANKNTKGDSCPGLHEFKPEHHVRLPPKSGPWYGLYILLLWRLNNRTPLRICLVYTVVTVCCLDWMNIFKIINLSSWKWYWARNYYWLLL